MRKVFVAMAMMALLAIPVLAAADSPVMSKFNVTFGGYVKLDYAYDTVKLGAALLPGPPGGGIPAEGTAAARQSESIFTVRQSRFWFKISGPELDGAKTNALIEADFYGGGGPSNEQPSLRLRQAYGTVDWASTQLLFGQAYDMFAPAIASTIDFRSGATTGAPNNPRVPMVKVSHDLKLGGGNALKLVVGVQNPVQDFAPSGTGGFGSMVNAAAQVFFSSTAMGVAPGYYAMAMKPLTIGVFGLYGNEKIEGNPTVNIWGYGEYLFVPLLKSADGKGRAMTLSFEEQAYVAAGQDVNGATAAALVGPAGNRHAAKGYGLYGQLIFYPTQDLGFTGGYGRRNALKFSDYVHNPAFEKRNELYYVNVAYDLNAAVRFAAEYEHAETFYASNPTGATGSKGILNSYRLAAFYFF